MQPRPPAACCTHCPPQNTGKVYPEHALLNRERKQESHQASLDLSELTQLRGYPPENAGSKSIRY